MNRFATELAGSLACGDTVLLRGPIGAGKTHLARALIHTLMEQPEPVPSPTFTLVQTYETPLGEVWHADLYRLSDASELVELGLEDALGSQIVLIEWPDRMPNSMFPQNALSIELNPVGDERKIRLRAQSHRWATFIASRSHD